MNKIVKRPKILGREVLDLLIEFIYLFIIFLIPLWLAFLFPTYNIFELNKIVLFKILIWIFLLLTSIKLIFYWPFFPFKDLKFNQWVKALYKYWLVPLIFILGISFTLLFSIDPVHSFFGSYERQQGLVSYLFYFFWFILLSFNILSINNGLLKKKGEDSLIKRVHRIVITTVISGSLVAVYGVLQIFNIDFLVWPEAPYLTHRVLSTFGQPNFLASFLLLTIPLSLYLLYYYRSFLSRLFYSLICLISLVCLFLTSSRGALLALVIIVLIFLFYLLRYSAMSRVKKIVASLILIFILFSGSISLEFILPGRLSSFFDYQNGSFAARLNFYSAAADSIIQRPIFGYGLENSGEQFIKYYEPNWGIYGDVNTSTDRAHNLLLDILLTTGFWGLIFFTILYYSFFALALENIRKQKEKALSLALALGAAGYLFSLIFSFTIVTGEVYFWLFFALLVVLNFSGPSRSISYKFVAGKWRLLKTVIVLILTLGTAWQIHSNLKVLVADYYFKRLYYLLAEKDYFTSFILDDYIHATKVNLVNQSFYNRFLGDNLSDVYPEIDELAAKVIAKEKLKLVFSDLPDRGYKNILVKAKISAALENFSISEKYFARLNNYTPHWPQGYLEEAKMFVLEHDLASAAAAFHLAEINLPDLNDSRLGGRQKEATQYYRYVIYLGLGNLYQQENRYEVAEKYYQLAYRDNPQDFTLFKKIADTYYFRNDFIQAIEYNQRGFKRAPRDYNWPLALAALYYEQEDTQQALFYLDQAIKLAPQNDDLLKLRWSYSQ